MLNRLPILLSLGDQSQQSQKITVQKITKNRKKFDFVNTASLTFQWVAFKVESIFLLEKEYSFMRGNSISSGIPL